MSLSLTGSACTLLFLATLTASQPWPPSASARARTLVGNMTLIEKLSLLQGSSPGAPHGYAGSLPAISRLTIPALTLEDGPQGVGDGLRDVTAWPSALAAAASWDTDLLTRWGAAMGREQYLKGTNVMLGPGTNLARVPLNGRLYEYYSEDPYLNSATVSSVVTGVQSNNGLMAMVKHFIGNSQEWNRGAEDAQIDERTLHEMYLPAYRAAVNSGVGAFMLGVNKIRGLENSANSETLNFLFDYGFEGWFCTDWAGIVVPNASAAALAGTSVEMPRGYQYQYLPEFIANGTVPIAVIDNLVVRVLTSAAALGVLDTPFDSNRNTSAIVTSPEHVALARELASRATILMKNIPPAGDTSPVLPLTPSRLTRGVLILGDNATVTGCGSGQVQTPVHVLSPFESLYEAWNPNAQRPNCSILPHTDFFQQTGDTCVTVTGATHDALVNSCSILCRTEMTCFVFTVVDGAACPGDPQPLPGQCFLKPNTDGQRVNPSLTSGICGPLPPSVPPLTYLTGFNDPSGAAVAAQGFDVVVIVVSNPTKEPEPGCEGVDRLSLALPPQADALISAIAAVHPRVVVVSRVGGAFLMPWIDNVVAVVHQGVAGQEASNALADVLTGAINPAGKLTVSFPIADNATWLTSIEQYPGIFNETTDPLFWRTTYTEGLFVGYRFYTAGTSNGTSPLFAFGHGLSYTTFNFSSLSINGFISSVTSATVSATITNIAGPSGRDTVQLYVAGALPGDPLLNLKGFVTTSVLAPQESVVVSFSLGQDELSFYNTTAGMWVLYPDGEYNIFVAAASNDLRLMGVVSVKV